MDLGLYWKVVSRHRRIAVVGLSLSLLLGLAAAYSVSSNGVERRGSELWEASSTLLVTQAGFPYGRSTLDEYVRAKGGSPDFVPRFSDPTRLQYLAALYAEFALGDDVRFLVRRASGLPGIPPIDEPAVVQPKFSATYGRADDGGAGLRATPLPTVILIGRAESEDAAVRLANVVSESLRKVISSQQTEASIPPGSRIVLPVMERAADAKLIEAVRPTGPLMLVLLGLMLTVGAIFVVDNANPKHAVGATPAVELAPPESDASIDTGVVRRKRQAVPLAPLDAEVKVGARRRSSSRRASS